MKISVVLATYNRYEKLRECLAAISAQTYQACEIIVVDDGSTDNTGALIQTDFPAINYIRQDINQGPAAARNRGIEAAGGDFIAFTDDDCIPPPNWLEEIAAACNKHPDVIGVGGYQDPPPHLIRLNAVARADHVSRVRRWGPCAHQPQKGGAEIPGLATNNVVYRRDLLLKIGGFDESFPLAAGEDADLKLRMAAQGTLLYLPLGVRHERNYTLPAQWGYGLRRGAGAYHFEKKHSKPPTRRRILLRLAKRTLKFFSDLLRTRPDVTLVMYMTAVADALGQWHALNQASARKRAPKSISYSKSNHDK